MLCSARDWPNIWEGTDEGNTVPLRKRPAAFGLVGGMWGIASVAGRKLKFSE